ncbi:CD99 antigen-like protein 2 isoform X2 [Zalophus californianus]|uniref:CD99 antigen-like protein 2 n=1 Tax=Zalophus californianus TaxID=9704 RepID=A0A6J2EHE0_ZALCA|nr:CD99 antigen-like protein 2 isoform X2 [Zalophus californianus]XP_027947760.1 CD99 antigen-like protein 2 isoform X2 [Eumetopias jubatus]
MVVWRSAFLICLAFSLATLFQRGSGDSNLRLEDALKETSSVKYDDFNLADALDDRNDRDDGRRKPSAGGGGGFSDKDLEDILGGGEYKPDKGDGRHGSDDSESGVSAEASTIAGVASALAMALIGAVSSYISYQQKKFCFSIQQGLNADYVKGENLEAVVCEEPQVKYLTLQTQAAEPPPPEAPRI